MDGLIIGLLVAVLAVGIATGAIVVAIFSRTRAGGRRTPDGLEQQFIRLERATGMRSVELQQVIDARLASMGERAEVEAHRRAQADAQTRLELQRTLNDRLAHIETRIAEQSRSQSLGLNAMRADNAAELEKIRASNEHHLEKMRVTVDEKLQGTLERRLGESFELVSKRLEQVQRGLGEMQTLAGDVGGLKRVLSNVKTRGVWGEALLSRQLQDVLTTGQYEENVEIRPGSGERVEFAVKLPGREPNACVYLPVDSKFPQQPYERLLDEREAAGDAGVTAAQKDLEKALRAQAKLISDKYLAVPYSTDFALMYLPTEGLYAEAMRIPGFADDVQRTYRVVVAGPTTLMALLNSLQMGFKTLAIEQRTSEVWQVLAAAKEEFGKYGQVWEKLEKQLRTAQNTVEEAGRRTRAVQRQLRTVEDPLEEAQEAALGPAGRPSDREADDPSGHHSE